MCSKQSYHFYLLYTELVGAQNPFCASLEVDKIIYQCQVAFSEPTAHHTVLTVQNRIDSIFRVYY